MDDAGSPNSNGQATPAPVAHASSQQPSAAAACGDGGQQGATEHPAGNSSGSVGGRPGPRSIELANGVTVIETPTPLPAFPDINTLHEDPSLPLATRVRNGAMRRIINYFSQQHVVIVPADAHSAVGRIQPEELLRGERGALLKGELTPPHAIFLHKAIVDSAVPVPDCHIARIWYEHPVIPPQDEYRLDTKTVIAYAYVPSDMIVREEKDWGSKLEVAYRMVMIEGNWFARAHILLLLRYDADTNALSASITWRTEKMRSSVEPPDEDTPSRLHTLNKSKFGLPPLRLAWFRGDGYPRDDANLSIEMRYQRVVEIDICRWLAQPANSRLPDSLSGCSVALVAGPPLPPIAASPLGAEKLRQYDAAMAGPPASESPSPTARLPTPRVATRFPPSPFAAPWVLAPNGPPGEGSTGGGAGLWRTGSGGISPSDVDEGPEIGGPQQADSSFNSQVWAPSSPLFEWPIERSRPDMLPMGPWTSFLFGYAWVPLAPGHPRIDPESGGYETARIFGRECVSLAFSAMAPPLEDNRIGPCTISWTPVVEGATLNVTTEEWANGASNTAVLPRAGARLMPPDYPSDVLRCIDRINGGRIRFALGETTVRRCPLRPDPRSLAEILRYQLAHGGRDTTRLRLESMTHSCQVLRIALQAVSVATIPATWRLKTASWAPGMEKLEQRLQALLAAPLPRYVTDMPYASAPVRLFAFLGAFCQGDDFSSWGARVIIDCRELEEALGVATEKSVATVSQRLGPFTDRYLAEWSFAKTAAEKVVSLVEKSGVNDYGSLPDLDFIRLVFRIAGMLLPRSRALIAAWDPGAYVRDRPALRDRVAAVAGILISDPERQAAFDAAQEADYFRRASAATAAGGDGGDGAEEGPDAWGDGLGAPPSEPLDMGGDVAAALQPLLNAAGGGSGSRFPSDGQQVDPSVYSLTGAGGRAGGAGPAGGLTTAAANSGSGNNSGAAPQARKLQQRRPVAPHERSIEELLADIEGEPVGGGSAAAASAAAPSGGGKKGGKGKKGGSGGGSSVSGSGPAAAAGGGGAAALARAASAGAATAAGGGGGHGGAASSLARAASAAAASSAAPPASGGGAAKSAAATDTTLLPDEPSQKSTAAAAVGAAVPPVPAAVPPVPADGPAAAAEAGGPGPSSSTGTTPASAAAAAPAAAPPAATAPQGKKAQKAAAAAAAATSKQQALKRSASGASAASASSAAAEGSGAPSKSAVVASPAASASPAVVTAAQAGSGSSAAVPPAAVAVVPSSSDVSSSAAEKKALVGGGSLQQAKGGDGGRGDGAVGEEEEDDADDISLLVPASLRNKSRMMAAAAAATTAVKGSLAASGAAPATKPVAPVGSTAAPPSAAAASPPRPGIAPVPSSSSSSVPSGPSSSSGNRAVEEAASHAAPQQQKQQQQSAGTRGSSGVKQQQQGSGKQQTPQQQQPGPAVPVRSASSSSSGPTVPVPEDHPQLHAATTSNGTAPAKAAAAASGAPHAPATVPAPRDPVLSHRLAVAERERAAALATITELRGALALTSRERESAVVAADALFKDLSDARAAANQAAVETSGLRRALAEACAARDAALESADTASSRAAASIAAVQASAREFASRAGAEMKHLRAEAEARKSGEEEGRAAVVAGLEGTIATLRQYIADLHSALSANGSVGPGVSGSGVGQALATGGSGGGGGPPFTTTVGVGGGGMPGIGAGPASSSPPLTGHLGGGGGGLPSLRQQQQQQGALMQMMMMGSQQQQQGMMAQQQGMMPQQQQQVQSMMMHLQQMQLNGSPPLPAQSSVSPFPAPPGHQRGPGGGADGAAPPLPPAPSPSGPMAQGHHRPNSPAQPPLPRSQPPPPPAPHPMQGHPMQGQQVHTMQQGQGHLSQGYQQPHGPTGLGPHTRTNSGGSGTTGGMPLMGGAGGPGTGSSSNGSMFNASSREFPLPPASANGPSPGSGPSSALHRQSSLQPQQQQQSRGVGSRQQSGANGASEAEGGGPPSTASLPFGSGSMPGLFSFPAHPAGHPGAGAGMQPGGGSGAFPQSFFSSVVFPAAGGGVPLSPGSGASRAAAATAAPLSSSPASSPSTADHNRAPHELLPRSSGSPCAVCGAPASLGLPASRHGHALCGNCAANEEDGASETEDSAFYAAADSQAMSQLGSMLSGFT